MSNFPIKTGHLFIGAAIILGLVTMIMFGMMGKPSDKPKIQEAELETMPVVVPLVPVVKGEVLRSDKLKVVKWPKDFLPEGQTYQTITPLIGRVPLQDLMPGEPIFSQKLSSPDTNGLPALIPSGLRALTVAVTETKGVAGFVKPGDKVDVLCTFSLSGTRPDGSRNKYYRTVTLAQDVLVLASAQTMVEEKQVDIETPEGVARGEVKTKSAPDKSEKEPKSRNRRKKEEDKKPEKSEKDVEKERRDVEKRQREAEKRAKLVSSVTVAVSPVQAQQITLAEQAGDLRLVLRSASDLRHATIEASESEDVVYPGKPKKPAYTPPPPQPRRPVLPPPLPQPSAPPMPSNTVELIEGTEKSSVQF